MTGLTSHRLCFLESIFRLSTQGRRIIIRKLIPLVIARFYNPLNDVGMQESSYSSSDENQNVYNDAGMTCVIDNIDPLKEYIQHRESFLAKRRPQELDDIALLVVNHIFVFTELVLSSITRHFDCIDTRHEIIRSLRICENVLTISPECSGNDWKEMQPKTVYYLNKALNSVNNVDLIVANILHRIGYADQRGEESFVHDVLSTLLDIVFSFDPSLNHFWANIRLDDVHKEFKPDYGVYANGLSKRFVILVAEFKPKEKRQQQESDFVKIGKQMRVMLNKLLEIGVIDPIVCSVLVKDDKLSTYKMHLQDKKVYVMTQICSIKIVKSSDDLVLLPSIISRLCQLKDISINTTKSLLTCVKKIKDGKAIIESSVPDTWICNASYTLSRKNEKPDKSE